MDYNSSIKIVDEDPEKQKECVDLLNEFNKQSIGTQIDYARKTIVFHVGQGEIMKRLMNRTVDLHIENDELKEQNQYLLESANLVDKAYVESMQKRHNSRPMHQGQSEARNKIIMIELDALLRKPIPKIKR